MNPWLIVLVIAVVAMILGPIMMLQPNAAQRSQEQLRRRAMELGLRVRIMSLPRQATDTETPAATPVYYLPAEPSEGSQAVEWLLIKASYDHAAHFLDRWQWHGRGRASAQETEVLTHILKALPPSVSAVEATLQGYGFYWSEVGGVTRLETLLPLLQQLQGVRKERS